VYQQANLSNRSSFVIGQALKNIHSVEVIEMPAVMQFMNGNCKVTILDDFVVQTETESNEILENVAKIYMQNRMRLARVSALEKQNNLTL
jgi:hypothetical protein